MTDELDFMYFALIVLLPVKVVRLRNFIAKNKIKLKPQKQSVNFK
jgi:hypothetical protein